VNCVASEGKEVSAGAVIGSTVAWLLAVFLSLACLFVGLGLFRTVPIFSGLFKDIGVRVPIATRLLLFNYVWLCPVVFGGIAILTIVAQWRLREIEKRLTAVAGGLVVALGCANLMVFVLYLPLIDLAKERDEVTFNCTNVSY
jgi:hypothetical protein